MDLSREAMQYVDELMSQPNPSMVEFWNMGNGGVEDASASMMPQPSHFPVPMAEQQALRQQALTLQTQPPKGDHVPPYLWSDPFTVMNTNFNEAFAEDTDMLGDDFDWQDWSQSIRGLEMESTQPR